ncbi:hypothetical protein JND52_15220, partial [Listeria monocytogenes]|nr:hypothetical protein [Listeria monocytogenes]
MGRLRCGIAADDGKAVAVYPLATADPVNAIADFAAEWRCNLVIDEATG